MAAQGSTQRMANMPRVTLGFGAMAILAVGLSLAAALAALREAKPGTYADAPSVAEELAERNERIQFFEQRAAADVLDVVSLNNLAFEYLQRARETGDVGEYSRARLAAEGSLAVRPDDNFKGLLAGASVSLVQHDFSGALAVADKAALLKPRDAAVHGLRSDALVGLGRYEEASRTLQTALETDAALPTLSRLAHLAFIQGNLVNAEDFWRQAISRGQGLPRENIAWAQVQLGRLYFARGDLAHAAQEYRKAQQTIRITSKRWRRSRV